MGKSRGVDGPRVKRHGAMLVYNNRRRPVRGVGTSELVADEAGPVQTRRPRIPANQMLRRSAFD